MISVKDRHRGDFEAMPDRGEKPWRNLLQTLLVGLGCGDVLGLLPGVAASNPGSPR